METILIYISADDGVTVMAGDYSAEWSRFIMSLEKIDDSYNIFDIVALLYDFVRDSAVTELAVLKKIRCLSQEEHYTKFLKLAKWLVISDRFARAFGELMIRYPYRQSILPSYYCALFIDGIDKQIISKAAPSGISSQTHIRTGPLNKLKEDILVYPKICHDMYSTLNKQIDFRKFADYESGLLNAWLDHFIIIKKESFQLNGSTVPQIFRLCDHNYFQKEIDDGHGIKVAMTPFCSHRCFGVHYEGDVFNIINPSGNEASLICKKYIRILEQCMRKGVQIVIFPELTLIPEALDTVKTFLSGYDEPTSLRLVITGSMWENQCNSIYMLSGQGIELFRYKKLVPYEYDDPRHPGAVYKENLDDSDENHNYLDIEGLGRLYFSICKDFISPRLDQYNKRLGTTIVFVPAYSPSLHLFRAHADHLAVEHKTTCFICNSCSGRLMNQSQEVTENTDVGFVSFPSKHGESNKAEFLYYRFDHCVSKCAENQLSCLEIVHIDPLTMNAVQQEGQSRHLNISLTTVLARSDAQ